MDPTTPAVGELAHADRVRRLHPFDRVPVDGEVPQVHLRRIDPREKCEVAGHHQPLDVVGIGVITRLAHRWARQAIFVVAPQ